MKKILYTLFILSMTVAFFSCSDNEMPYKPEPSDFKAQLEGSNQISAEGGVVNVKIEAGTNGWWVTMTEGMNWCKAGKNFGGGDYTLPLTISKNETGEDRSVVVTIHSTYDLPAADFTIKQSK